VAATKTYTSQLAVLALFWATWCDDATLLGALQTGVPEAMRAALSLEAEIAEIAQWLRFSERLLVTARGLQLRHRPRGGAQVQGDLVHRRHALLGRRPHARPIAMVEPGYPALLFALTGRALPPCGSSSATCWSARPNWWS